MLRFRFIEKAPVDRSGSACAAPVIGPLRAVVIPKDRRRPEPTMSAPRSLATVLQQHVTLEVEGIDRMYLNVYQPKLQAEKQAACFFLCGKEKANDVLSPVAQQRRGFTVSPLPDGSSLAGNVFDE